MPISKYIGFSNLRQFVPTAKGGQREQPITVELGAILERERAMRDDPDAWIFRHHMPIAAPGIAPAWTTRFATQ